MEERNDRLTHLDTDGNARMVDVSAKDRTVREAVAEALVVCAPDTVALIRAGDVPKGDVLAVVRVAGIAGAKRTPDLVPLCHPVALTGVQVDVAVEAGLDDERWGVSAAFSDVDRDGDLDLYVTNYIEFTFDRYPARGEPGFDGEPPCSWKGVAVTCGPRNMQAAPDAMPSCWPPKSVE